MKLDSMLLTTETLLPIIHRTFEIMQAAKANGVITEKDMELYISSIAEPVRISSIYHMMAVFSLSNNDLLQAVNQLIKPDILRLELPSTDDRIMAVLFRCVEEMRCYNIAREYLIAMGMYMECGNRYELLGRLYCGERNGDAHILKLLKDVLTRGGETGAANDD